MIEPVDVQSVTSDRQVRASPIVARYTLLCAAATAIPVWWASSTSVTGLQLKMLSEISRVYDVEFSQDLARPLIASIAGGGISLLMSQNPWSLALKSWIVMVPVVGLPLRLGTGPAIMAAYTHLLAWAFVEHYEAGGSYHDFDVKRLRLHALTLLRRMESRWAGPGAPIARRVPPPDAPIEPDMAPC